MTAHMRATNLFGESEDEEIQPAVETNGTLQVDTASITPNPIRMMMICGRETLGSEYLSFTLREIPITPPYDPLTPPVDPLQPPGDTLHQPVAQGKPVQPDGKTADVEDPPKHLSEVVDSEATLKKRKGRVAPPSFANPQMMCYMSAACGVIQAAIVRGVPCSDELATLLNGGYDLSGAETFAKECGIDISVGDSVVEAISHLSRRCEVLSTSMSSIYESTQHCPHCKALVHYRGDPTHPIDEVRHMWRLAGKTGTVTCNLEKLMRGPDATTDCVRGAEFITCTMCGTKKKLPEVERRSRLRQPADLILVEVVREMADTSNRKVKQFPVETELTQELMWEGPDHEYYQSTYELTTIVIWSGNTENRDDIGHYTYIVKPRQHHAEGGWYWMNPRPGHNTAACTRVDEFRIRRFQTQVGEVPGLVCLLAYVRTTTDPMGKGERKSRLRTLFAGDTQGSMREDQVLNCRKSEEGHESNESIDAKREITTTVVVESEAGVQTPVVVFDPIAQR